jgi:hypothetical protein
VLCRLCVWAARSTDSRGARAWAVEGSEYAAEEPSSLLRYEFVLSRQYTVFTTFHASSDTGIPRTYDRLGSRLLL